MLGVVNFNLNIYIYKIVSRWNHHTFPKASSSSKQSARVAFKHASFNDPGEVLNPRQAHVPRLDFYVNQDASRCKTSNFPFSKTKQTETLHTEYFKSF